MSSTAGITCTEWARFFVVRCVTPSSCCEGASLASGTMGRMCRNIRPLNNFEPPASRDEVHDAALQYVRKVAGMSKPSKANEAVFYQAVAEIAHATQHLLEDLVSAAPPKTREVEAAKAKARSAHRFATA